MGRHKNSWFKLITLVLALVLIMPILAACGKERETTPTSSPIPTETPGLAVTPTAIYVPTPTQTPMATTPTPTKYIAWSFAVITDLHVGREFSDYDGNGYNDLGTPLSVTAVGYVRDAVNKINEMVHVQNIAFVIVLGDITNNAEASEFRAAKQILDGLTVPWIPVMGNHDMWPYAAGQEAPSSNPPPESYFDNIIGAEYSNLATELSGWGRESPSLVYDPEIVRYTYFENFFFDYGGFHFVGLDLNSRTHAANFGGVMPGGDLHDFAGGTWDWFKQHMEHFVQQNPEGYRDVILLAHHPMRSYDSFGIVTFSGSESDYMSSFLNNTYYSYVDSLGITYTGSYASRIWGELSGHLHPSALSVEPSPWSNESPVITYPMNYEGVRIGIVNVTSNTPNGVDYSEQWPTPTPTHTITPTPMPTSTPTGVIHTGLDINSKIGDLMANPYTLAVLQKWLPDVFAIAGKWAPGFCTNPQATMVCSMTILQVQPLSSGLITQAQVDGIATDLAAIK